MSNDQSQKKYRGFKYIILAVLFAGAIGFAYFSMGGLQTDDRKAEVKGAASSMVAAATQQGDKMMAKATELKDGLSDSMDKGRETMSDLGSGMVEKVDQMAKSAMETGTQWVEDKKSTMPATDGIDANTAPPEQLVGQASSAMGAGTSQVEKAIDSQAQALDTPTVGILSMQDPMTEITSDMMASGTGGVDEAIDGVSGDLKTGTSQSRETMNAYFQSGAVMRDAGAAADQMMAKGDPASGTVEVPGAPVSSGTQAAAMETVVSARRAATSSAPFVYGEDQPRDTDAMIQGEHTPVSIKRCVGPPPRGKDMGNRYIVASCETLGIISKRTGVGIKDLINRNPQVGNPDLIYPDQSLWLPPRG